MYPTDFEGSNKQFSAPKGLTEKEVKTLHVRQGIVNEWVCNTSHWMPTAEELKALNEGKGIYLNIFGSGHPVVSMSTEKPF